MPSTVQTTNESKNDMGSSKTKANAAGNRRTQLRLPAMVSLANLPSCLLPSSPSSRPRRHRHRFAGDMDLDDPPSPPALAELWLAPLLARFPRWRSYAASGATVPTQSAPSRDPPLRHRRTELQPAAGPPRAACPPARCARARGALPRGLAARGPARRPAVRILRTRCLSRWCTR